MHGETRGGNRRYYRCSIPRSYPQASPEHPTSVYVREDALVRAVDEWIGELFSPAHLADTAQQLVDAAGIDTDRTDQIAAARRHLAEARHEIAQCRATLRAGGDPETLSSWITQAADQERAAQAELETAMSACPPALRVEDVEALVHELGGLAPILEQADPVDRIALYQAFGIAATYDATTQTAVLQVEPAWGQLCVGGGTRGLRQRPC